MSPLDVASLTSKGTRVLVQPSPMRIFPDAAYSRAGAILTDDLRSANTIFGVKEFPHTSLLDSKSYVLFSHTIKAQEYNMPFLDACLEKRVRLFDYETIRDTKSNKRLVAFGQFAGYSGMCATLRGLGERLLSLGFSTPFVSVSSAYMYPSLSDAKQAITRCGQQISEYGLPSQLGPMTFVFTGTGNVSNGAKALFELLPHRWLTVEQMQELKHNSQSSTSNWERNVVYGCIVTSRDMVRLSAEQQSDKSSAFDKSHYYAQPHLYESIFHSHVIPYTSVLINCMYWAPQYPRLLTCQQMQALEQKYTKQGTSQHMKNRLLMVSDITCDIGGSVEFLKRSSSIDAPFYMYDALKDSIHAQIEGQSGVLMLGVDNLPAEFPIEASLHFSQALAPFVQPLSEFEPEMKFDSDEARTLLPQSIYASCIAADGRLTPQFAYIEKLRRLNDKKAASDRAASVVAPSNGAAAVATDAFTHTLMLEGHLFDTGFINSALDAIEQCDCDFRVQHWDIQANRSQRESNTSKAVLSINAKNQEQFARVILRLEQLAQRAPAAQVKVTRIERDIESYIPQARIASSQQQQQLQSTQQQNQIKPSTTSASASTQSTVKSSGQSVLVLGSGFVVGPLIEYLARQGHSLTVASNQLTEAQTLLQGVQCSVGASIQALLLDSSDTQAVSALVQQHTITVSLLPATMHVSIAQLCLTHRKHLITASYVSDAMRALSSEAQRLNLTFLNEVGLDPGLDHMSAMSVIDEVKLRGGTVLEFESVCGGLPAPECANNPFAYKFSWSPAGMLSATRNSATYRHKGAELQIEGERLMSSATPYDGLGSALRLEHYANRNSLGYSELYALPGAQTMYRGTLRYDGTCALLHAMRQLGLFSQEKITDPPVDWSSLLQRQFNTSQVTLMDVARSKLHAAGTNESTITRTLAALRWLGLDQSETLLLRGTLNKTKQHSMLDYLCALLIERLSYQAGERDMVLLAHRFVIQWPGVEQLETRRSTLIAYGGDGPQRVGGSLGAGGGVSGWSAMSRTVGLPCAIATQLVLEGRIKQRGVLIPTSKEVYEPMLQLLAQEGIQCREEIVRE